MGSWNPKTREMDGVDEQEVFVDSLYEYEFASPDPDDQGSEPYRFYDAGGNNLPYTMQAVLEYYYRQGHAVRITIEDAGLADPGKEERRRMEAYRREQALITLEAEARHRAKQRHQSKY